MKKVSLKRCAAVCAAIVLMAGVLQAGPIAGIFDSRTDSTIIAGIPWAEGALVCSFWEDCTAVIGLFDGWGSKDGVSQWYIQAWNPDWAGWAGYIQLNWNGPWFGDNPEEVGGYEGQITEWTLSETYTGEFLDLVLTGTAVLDKKHLMPWYDGQYEQYEDMSPVPVTFEMGFSGIPEQGSAETYNEGTIFGTPSYVVFTIPEPATMGLLGLGGILLRKRTR
ncbi:MAG TPA: PEP-CTERM sorting domain-containing protein [Anaerohalosphaeraceae bacterium]|nr:PEP-CTERM sorting domain-containing protein [Anaerohalosphaeraceae bacterium]HQG06046.1 PEP-CTERM sorting domain-containing protein [Anaerohalosphaeraceae bacterium]HQI07539.1 PEP-CTERM sorting domain-containing protein [Anaerohalosphaeraceae bacterium]HQJ67755.1 PEP-CTERM sorting domain-containing protein [Anaerohalosphaeraceae bacterium]